MKKKLLKISIVFIVIFALFSILSYTQAEENTLERNYTRAYFCTKITKDYGNGDCILLENCDENGNIKYGLIDTGRKIVTEDEEGNQSTVVVEFLKSHNVEKLDFLILTHQHNDHTGDAESVLNNFEVEKIYMKEFDTKWSLNGNRTLYETIMKKIIDKNIKVIGTSYLSLVSDEISPNRTASFKEYVVNAREELFESFNSNNTVFDFGSAQINILNWEIFCSDGTQYITGTTIDKTKEIVTDENNNSLGCLLIQGNKRAFFSGDINNYDENSETGRIGDETRLKDIIGKVDFLKLGHHGYSGSNTEDYLNTLDPEYAIITNDIGKAYIETINTLNNNNVDYLYVTEDENEVSSTITNNEVFLGFLTGGVYKEFNNVGYYIPKNESNKYKDYRNYLYRVEYVEKEVQAGSWEELKNIIENNITDYASIDDENKIYKKYNLKINLYNQGDWTVDKIIDINKGQRISLISEENIIMLRGTEYKDDAMFNIEGTLSIGASDMQGEIYLDGNKENVASTSQIVIVNSGTLNLEEHSTVCNNLIRTTQITTSSDVRVDHSAIGSGIFGRGGVININGGNVINNEQDVNLTETLPKEILKKYRYATFGTGIYMRHGCILNMNSGKISNNVAQNNSNVITNSEYTINPSNSTIYQNCLGVGIYAYEDSEINLNGGEISYNVAKNNSRITLKKSTNENYMTNINILNNNIYGVGVYSHNAKLRIGDKFELKNNTAELNSTIILEENTEIKSYVSSATRGLQIYTQNTDLQIDGAKISNGSFINNINVQNDGKIGSTGNDVKVENYGTGITLVSTESFDINNMTLENCKTERGAISIVDSSGVIKNSNIINNESTTIGGGIYSENSNLKIENTEISENKATYGGGIYVLGENSNTELKNTIITDNTAFEGSGGGIYSNGIVTVLGENTLISQNNANTYGGGIMIEGEAKLYEGKIYDNTSNIDGNNIFPIEKITEETIKPVINVDEIPNELTLEDIKVSFNASDYESGVKEVEVNNNKMAEENGIYEFVAEENGIYQIKVTDNMGNQEIREIEINTIAMLGDVNLDNKINLGDILALKRHRVSDKNPEWKLREDRIKIGDINKNNNIDIGDILKILRYISASSNSETAIKHKDWLNL